MADKHTPGPWKGQPTSGGETLVVCRNGARQDGQAVGQIYRAHDARLIAAAPELLSLARAIEATSDSDADNIDKWAFLVRLARAAIAKATGEGGPA